MYCTALKSVQYSTYPKRSLSPIWLRRKNYPPHAQRNIKNSSKPLNISNAENTKTNSVDVKEKWKAVIVLIKKQFNDFYRTQICHMRLRHYHLMLRLYLQPRLL